MEFFFGENFAHVANFFPTNDENFDHVMKTLTRDENFDT